MGYQKTDFGKFCNKLRIDNNELMRDMAKRLCVSPAFLSKVECGNSKPPMKWKEKIADLYTLTGEQEEELNRFIDMEHTRTNLDICISLTTLFKSMRSILFSFIINKRG